MTVTPKGQKHERSWRIQKLKEFCMPGVKNTSGINARHEIIEVIRLTIMKNLGLVPESKRESNRSFMTREKSNPEDISIIADWENRERKREKGDRERVRESKRLRKRKG